MSENKTIEKNEGLVDPMCFDSEEGLAEKKEIWNDIFQRCPEAADTIAEIYKKHGEEGMKVLASILKQIIEFCDK